MNGNPADKPAYSKQQHKQCCDLEKCRNTLFSAVVLGFRSLRKRRGGSTFFIIDEIFDCVFVHLVPCFISHNRNDRFAVRVVDCYYLVVVGNVVRHFFGKDP